jgi:hypothetical protein
MFKIIKKVEKNKFQPQITEYYTQHDMKIYGHYVCYIFSTPSWNSGSCFFPPNWWIRKKNVFYTKKSDEQCHILEIVQFLPLQPLEWIGVSYHNWGKTWYIWKIKITSVIEKSERKKWHVLKKWYSFYFTPWSEWGEFSQHRQ